MNGSRRTITALIAVGEGIGGASIVVPVDEHRDVMFDALGEDVEGPYLLADGDRYYLGDENGTLASLAMEQDVITVLRMPEVGDYEQYAIRADAPEAGIGSP